MGILSEEGYAEGVREGWVSLSQAITANLTSNHFPPIPLAYVIPVMRAVEIVNEGTDEEIVVNITVIRRTGVIPLQAYEVGDQLFISASDLLNITHSWAFCEPKED
jgi:hypothetical protein